MVDRFVFLTWNLLTATAPSDSALTANGVTFREKVMELKTATTVKAWVVMCRDGGLCYLPYVSYWSKHLLFILYQDIRYRHILIKYIVYIDPTAKYLSCIKFLAQSHVQGESAHTGYHHDDGSHAHCEALDDPGTLQYSPLFGSHLCWGDNRGREREMIKKQQPNRVWKKNGWVTSKGPPVHIQSTMT